MIVVALSESFIVFHPATLCRHEQQSGHTHTVSIAPGNCAVWESLLTQLPTVSQFEVFLCERVCVC